MAETMTMVLTCDADAVEDLYALLREHDADAQRSTRRNLDGEAATTWVLVAGVAVQTAPALLDSLRKFLTRNRVEEIKVGDVTVRNPGPEEIASAFGRPHQ